VGRVYPIKITEDVFEYLSHNELGIALELIADVAIEDNWNISTSAKIAILDTFKKMNYHETDKVQFKIYELWANGNSL